jgi:hypothetical protein
MEPEIILAKLRALMQRAPDFKDYSPTSSEHMVWLGQAHALVNKWNPVDAISFTINSNCLSSEVMRNGSIARIYGTLYRAIADLELTLPADSQGTFAAGEVYKFFQELNKVIKSAEESIFIIDPYLDHTVFDLYLNSRQPEVSVRLLLKKNADTVKPATQKYVEQYGDVVEVRRIKTIHDRVIFVDKDVCWVVGQSLKDAAKNTPTYLLPLAPDIVADKLQQYEELWSVAVPI